ncbi:hypothetical protein Peur_058293 [Populus x canadensis]
MLLKGKSFHACPKFKVIFNSRFLRGLKNLPHRITSVPSTETVSAVGNDVSTRRRLYDFFLTGSGFLSLFFTLDLLSMHRVIAFGFRVRLI